MRIGPYSEKTIAASIRVLEACLSLRQPGKQLLIIADETALSAAIVFHLAACELELHSAVVFIAKRAQEAIVFEEGLPRVVEAAMLEADAVITCVNDDTTCTPFRKAILLKKRGGLRIAHMPGVTTRMIASTMNADYSQIADQCQCLVLPLLKGDYIEITTGKKHVLSAKLGSWTRIPIPSTGIIEEGSWGNIPSGETYIAPLEGTAEGEILIDGSLLGRALRPNESAVLTFKSGMLHDVHTRVQWIESAFLQLETDANAKDDPDWRNLAEIGIGTNPRVRTLTGVSLVDEKMAGTAHIALGSNIEMGGTVQSSIHKDLVFRSPTITVDGLPILHKGKKTVNPTDWWESEITPTQEDLSDLRGCSFSRSGVPTQVSQLGTIERVVETGSGRRLYAPLGTADVARVMAKLHARLPEFGGDSVAFSSLVEEVGSNDLDTAACLSLMEKVGLVTKHRC